MSVPLRGEGVLEQISDTRFKGSAGGESIVLDFVLDGEGPAQSFILVRKGENITFNRK